MARDAEIGDRVAEELQAWLGDPDAVAVLEPRTALAYERSELVRDETAARVAALAAWRSGRARVLVASVQALLQHTLDPDELPAEPRRLRVGARIHQDELLHDLLALGYDPVLEVAGRGEFARRGGLVDVFPSAAPLPIRIELFGDEIDSMRVFDPTDQRSLRPVDEVVLLPASEFLVPPGGVAEIRDRVGAPAAAVRSCRSGWPRTWPASRKGSTPARASSGRMPATSTTSPRPPAPSRPATRPRSGPPSCAPRPASTTCRSSTLLVLDEPGDIADAADFLWRQAEERRTELVAAGDLPDDWPEAYLGPARLEVAPAAGPYARADLGIGGRRAYRRRHADGRSLRLARARPAAGPDRATGRDGRGLGRRGRARRAHLGPGAPAGRRCWPSRACRPGSSITWPKRRRRARGRSSGGA